MYITGYSLQRVRLYRDSWNACPSLKHITRHSQVIVNPKVFVYDEIQIMERILAHWGNFHCLRQAAFWRLDPCIQYEHSGAAFGSDLTVHLQHLQTWMKNQI